MGMSTLNQCTAFLEKVDLKAYRDRYRPIKIVEMDLPKNIQALELMYRVYWDERRFIDYDAFWQEYESRYRQELLAFRKKTQMCQNCFSLGLPARIYRTWASLITQIHAGYVAESVFGRGSVQMSALLDHQGADFQVYYKGHVLNYQIKKESHSREVRKQKVSKKKIDGEFIDLFYHVPAQAIFDQPLTRKGEQRKPYKMFTENQNLRRLQNGFVVFTPHAFEWKKREIDGR